MLSDVAEANLPGVGWFLPKAVLRYVAYGFSGLSLELYDYLDWISKQAIPYTAEGEFLEGWANLKGVFRKAATPAFGNVQLTGTIGTTIPNGTIVQRGDGLQYSTISIATNTAGTVAISIRAIDSGSIGNADTGITLTLASPIAGMNSTGVASTALTGGTDIETDASLQARMIQAYSNPPQGGALSDYVTWALEVPGVTRAWSSAGGAGAGSVTVYTMFDLNAFGGFPQGTNGGATDETRIAPATLDLLTVADFLYPLRPATALVYSVAPVAASQNLTITNLSPNTSDIQTAITAALSDLFMTKGSPLGSTIYPSDIGDAIASVPGVLRFYCTTGLITTTTGQLPTLGTITFS